MASFVWFPIVYHFEEFVIFVNVAQLQKADCAHYYVHVHNGVLQIDYVNSPLRAPPPIRAPPPF